MDVIDFQCNKWESPESSLWLPEEQEEDEITVEDSNLFPYPHYHSVPDYLGGLYSALESPNNILFTRSHSLRYCKFPPLN